MIFISYSRADWAPASDLVDALASEGIDCWMDESNIPVGQAFVAQIGEALKQSTGFLLVDTPASRRSYWVSREIKTARRYRRDGDYHTLLRIYSPRCEDEDATYWDGSISLGKRAHTKVGQFLLGRSTSSPMVARNAGIPGVLIGSDGLGQPTNWTGRQDELGVLDQWWLGPTPGVWLRGLGGIGKSGLVQTWVTALAHLGYDEPVSANVLHVQGREVVDTNEVIGRISAWGTQAGYACKLFLLDGYDEGSAGGNLDVLLHTALQLGSRVIVTSRSSTPFSLVKSFSEVGLASMSRRDAVATLAEFGIAGPEGAEVAVELGDHPLALMLFARHVATENLTATEALQVLRSSTSKGLGSSPRLDRSMRAALTASLSTLTPDSKRLLRTLCGVHELGNSLSAGPSRHLQAARPGTILELARASLIQVDSLDKPTTVNIHPLVRQFVADEGSSEARATSVAQGGHAG